MPRCEDYPCCGHEAGDCPRINEDGQEVWRCASCHKELPVNNRSSLCDKCRTLTYSDEDYDND